MTERRSIHCYVSQAGNNKIAEWYQRLSVTEQAAADVFIDLMRKTRNWTLPEYRSKLAGKSGLGELRWVSNNKQHRLIGFFKGLRWYAVVGCTHKGNVYSPPNALDTALKRKKQIERGEVATVEYDL